MPSADQDDTCDYPPARNRVLLTTATARAVIRAFIATARQPR